MSINITAESNYGFKPIAPQYEVLITCVQFDDVLAETLPTTVGLFGHNNITIVTTPQDKPTARLCHKLGVRCLQTDEFHRNGNFNKAKGIRYGLMHLEQRDWIIHMDSDIALPNSFHGMSSHRVLDPSCIYGIDRVNCPGITAWREHLHNPEHQYEWSCLMKPPHKWQVGARIIHPDYGYAPIGFFQMWHGSARKTYPQLHGSAERTDLLHSLQWPREKRILLPELFAVHIDVSHGKPMGVNWAGRTTPK